MCSYVITVLKYYVVVMTICLCTTVKFCKQEKNSSAAKTRKARITNLNTCRLGNVRAHWSLYWINKIIKHTKSVHYNNLL